MLDNKEIIKLIQSQGNKINNKIIKELIQTHLPVKNKMIKLYSEYEGDVAIKKRTFVDTKKINNKIPSDFRGDIIDGLVGYMFGEPITYSINKDKYEKNVLNKLDDTLKTFLKRNDIEDLDSTTGEFMSICGYGARLLYVDKEGKERVMNLKPWETIFIMDPTLDEIQYGMIYYDIEVIEGDTKKKRTIVEWYDKKFVYYFITDDNDDYILDNSFPINPQLHLFDYVPLIKFSNNNSEQGDFEKIDEDIDAYDRIISDMQNEIEEFRLAYMAFYGVEPTQQVLETARMTGAFQFPEDTDARFITKPLDSAVQFLENHKKTLNDNIYKFSKSVDMRDEQFSGAAMSGESRKWKLVNLENKAKTKERKFIKALRYQFKVLCSAFAKKEIKLKYEDIDFQFKRNLPIDLQYHASVTQGFRGNISDITRLSLMPFIPDPEKELQLMKDDYDMIDFSEDTDNQNQDTNQE